jgi:hypothetical protein
MAELTSDEAIARARTAMGLDAAVPARAWRIRRLDRTVDVYYLVVFGAPDAAVAVTTVGAARGEVRTSAHLPGVRPHLLIDAAQAVTLAGLGARAHAELVWRPSHVSRSPFYPLWEVRNATTRVYVDQQGVVWQALDMAGHAG